MIGVIVVIIIVAVFAWTRYWLNKAWDWNHEGVAMLIAALPWLIGLACLINMYVAEPVSEPTCQCVED